jgi:hypothetical protein
MDYTLFLSRLCVLIVPKFANGEVYFALFNRIERRLQVRGS